MDARGALPSRGTGHAAPSERDAERGDAYAVIGAMLLVPADTTLLYLLQKSSPPVSDDMFAQAWDGLAQAAADTSAPAVAAEHAALFVAVGSPLVDPRACAYLGRGALDALREDLRALGLVRRRSAYWTEDHLGALCEVMRLLTGTPGSQSLQSHFFREHLCPWYGACLSDLRLAEEAPFHAALAGVAQAFMDRERGELACDGAIAPPH